MLWKTLNTVLMCLTPVAAILAVLTDDIVKGIAWLIFGSVLFIMENVRDIKEQQDELIKRLDINSRL